MKKTLALLSFVFVLVTAGYAQRVTGSIQGKLYDSLYVETLVDATVTVLHATDSTVINYTLANDKGEFLIKNIDAGAYRLMISYQGYNPKYLKFSITADSANVQFGTIYMDKKNSMLAEVVVEAPPIIVKKDTVEFRADAFKTKPNATAEDLLKKLPGVQVDREGNVKAQGEDIPKIYVDGKEFFGTDPKMATKNITADMIESVQVFDDMSDQAKFTRIDDGSRSKTINIKLKKDKRQGYFGRFTAGAGNNDRYQASGMFNLFNNDRRITIQAGSNNINRQSFSFNDVVGTMGGGGSRGGGGGGFGGGGRGGGGRGGGFGGGGFSSGNTGISKNHSIGLNYTDKWGSKVDVAGSYSFTSTENEREQQTLTQQLFDDSLVVRNEDMRSASKNQNHRFNMRIEYYIDSMNSVLITPNVTMQHSESYSYDTLFTRSIKDVDYLANEGKRINSSTRDGYSISNNILYRRKFSKVGRTLTLGLNSAINNSESNSLSQSPLRFYNEAGDLISSTNQDIQSKQITKSVSNVISTSFTEPIGANKILELNYAYTDRRNTSDRDAYDFNGFNAKYDSLNLAQTNYFENDFIAHRGGANFRVQNKMYSWQIGGAVEHSALNNFSQRALTGDTVVKQQFLNFFPTANFNYMFSRSKNLRVFYRGRTNQPNISQLQDAPDVTNILSISNGNPGLKQEFSNNLNIGYNTFDAVTFRFFSGNVTVSNTQNKIVNSVDSLPVAMRNRLGIDSSIQGAQLLVPVNLNGNLNASSFLTVGFPLQGAMKGSSINLSNNISYNRDLSLIYKKQNVTNTFAVTQSAGINLDIKESLILGLNASLAYNKVSYSQQSNLNDEYYTQTYSVDVSYSFLKRMVLATDFDYFVNTGRANGFNQNIPLWNASLAYQLFPKRNGELRFSVNDLMNQNQSITRNVSENYIQDTRSNVLRRYFLLTFTYNLNKAGAPQQQKRQGPQLPRSIERQMERNMNNGTRGGMPMIRN